ncbi:ubiquitin carboxyl-terminal hydrolase 19-like isoform X2 [Physella acuta]|nr:ubiquitin carboxyl-terminal hydrolase 19-like isoform X2 [Physella acuta]
MQTLQKAEKQTDLDQNQDENGFSCNWSQTLSDITVTITPHKPIPPPCSYDISFTSKEVNISVSADLAYVIRFFGAIEKDKSRVKLGKNSIILLITKQNETLWPCLEEVQEGSLKDICIDGLDEKTMEVDDVEMPAAVEEADKKNEPLGIEIIEKDEEPVYLLELLKHDYIERDCVITVYVYTKDLDKDAVKVTFSKQGFVLKFQSGDQKFLELHQGSSRDTVFTWPVTTREEIIPENCKFKVFQSKIEITLGKTCNKKWASLEALSRKENSDKSRSDSWIPITKSNVTTKEVSTAKVSDAKSSKVMFDDLSDINVRGPRSKVALAPECLQRNDTESEMGAAMGDNLKLRSNLPYELNKPTAKVQPLNNQSIESGMVVSPGFSGLVNLGNTCFMNCVLQVLANTREFRDYFLDGRFQAEINEDNPLGMKGQLASTFGMLMRSLWSCKKQCWEPRKLKDLISKKNPQFFGYAQHDAHEFLAFLLDGLHEDLNRIRKKPYTQTVDSDGRPDEVVASEAWAQYKQRNDSVVVDLFQGQYKSKLVCPKCGKVSITFDPFLYLSVPLPKKMKIVPVNFMWKESYKKPVRYQIQLSYESTVEKLKEELSARTGVQACDIRVFEAYKGRIHRRFPPRYSLASVEQKDVIIACEVLSEELAGEEVIELLVMQRTLFPVDYPTTCSSCLKTCHDPSNQLKRCTKCFKVGYCDRLCQKTHWNQHKSSCSVQPEPIGCPFILSVPASRATYGYLIKHMEGFSRFSVDIFQPPVRSTEVGNKPSSNLSSSLSQSCSSLNSLDSLSSASSTCTLTGDQSDPQAQLDGEEDIGETISSNINAVDSECAVSSGICSQTASSDSFDTTRHSNQDSGLDSVSFKSSEKQVPMSHVMGMQVGDVERDRAMPTFFIKPVNLEGDGIKGADRLEDKGDQPLEFPYRNLSMDWRNNEKLQSFVLVQSKELEAEEADNLNNLAAACNKPTLSQCLELFTEPEVLSPEEAWYCPACKKHVEASKQMAVWRLPHTLVIQLKRFSFQNFLMRSKIKKHIDFPTRGLDMTPFCHGLKPNEPPAIYDLYGVANHHGLLIGGHYTSYVKLAGDNLTGADDVGWRLCDDSRVSPVPNEKSVVTPDAYLLFYRRRGCHATIGNSVTNLEASEASATLLYSNVEDERNGNILPTPSTNMRIKESVNNKLLRELKRGEASERCSYEKMNIVNMCRDQAPFGDSGRIMSQYPVSQLPRGRAHVGEGDDTEKGDKEKDSYDADTEKYDYNYDDDEREEDDGEARSLVIDTGSDLGYTDMEAVD